MTPRQTLHALRGSPSRRIAIAGPLALAIAGLGLAVLFPLVGHGCGAVGRPPIAARLAQPASPPPHEWSYIVIHHSAGPRGNAAEFDREHRLKGWDELGYHFVIGNGTGSRDGQIEVGPRWTKQKCGAHCKTHSERFNEQGIGICLVGNFENTSPTAAQMASLRSLVAALADKYHIPPGNIVGHHEAFALDGETRTTQCPGRHFDLAALRRSVGRQLAAGRG